MEKVLAINQKENQKPDLRKKTIRSSDAKPKKRFYAAKKKSKK